MSNQNDLDFLTTEEIAEILKVKARTVRDYIQQGELPAVSLKGGYRVYRKDLNNFLSQRYKRPEKKE